MYTSTKFSSSLSMLFHTRVICNKSDKLTHNTYTHTHTHNTYTQHTHTLQFNKFRRKANHHRVLSKSTTSLTRIDNTTTIDQHYPENSKRRHTVMPCMVSLFGSRTGQSTLSLIRTSSNIAIDGSLTSNSFPDMDIFTEMDHVPPARGRSHTITMGMKGRIK